MRYFFECVKIGGPKKAFRLQTGKSLVPKAGEVMIEVEAFGLNFADVLARLGLYPDAPKRPCVLGYEVLGRVKKTGKGAEVLKGKCVLALTRFGGYSTQVVCPVLSCMEVPKWSLGNKEVEARTDIEAQKSHEIVSLLSLATQGCTAWVLAEETVVLRAGMRAVVLAASGGVGSFLVHLLKRKGVWVCGVSHMRSKKEFLIQNGVDAVVIGQGKDWFEEVRNRFGKVDVVFDSVGGLFETRALSLLRAGGSWIHYGVAQFVEEGKPSWYLRAKAVKLFLKWGWIHPTTLMQASRSICGVNLLAIAEQNPEFLKNVFKNLLRFYQKEGNAWMGGQLFSSKDFFKAHTLLERGKHVGKIGILWDL